MYAPLADGLAALGLAVEPAGGVLTRYIDEIETFNPAYGLVKVKDRRELVVRHILDSLAPLGILRRQLPVVGGGPVCVGDAGSGAGLPGIPLAICYPEARFSLIERMGRRAGFLRDALAVLALGNAVVEEAGVEQAAPGRFDAVVFRAFRPLDKRLLGNLFRLLAPGDSPFLAAWKGRREAAASEIAALGGCSWETFPVKVPFLEEERTLLVIRRETS